MQANHEPIIMFYNIDIILSIFNFSKPIESLSDMHFNGFIASSKCVHKIMGQANNVSKLLG